MSCEKGETSRAVPLHEVATKLETTVIDILPVLQALTGCDMTSKMFCKNAALKTAETGKVENLVAFGKTHNNVDIIIAAEKLLVKWIHGKTSCESFNELKMDYYHQEWKFNFGKIPPTSASIHKHIQ